MSGPRRRAATASAFSSSTIPVHRQWPMFEVSESMGRLSASRPTAKYCCSSSQKSRLKATFRSLAFCR